MVDLNTQPHHAKTSKQFRTPPDHLQFHVMYVLSLVKYLINNLIWWDGKRKRWGPPKVEALGCGPGCSALGSALYPVYRYCVSKLSDTKIGMPSWLRYTQNSAVFLKSQYSCYVLISELVNISGFYWLIFHKSV
jgi:hypothetical protein